MKKILITTIILITFCLSGVVYAANLDEFNGKTLDKMWTYRDPAKKGTYRLEG